MIPTVHSSAATDIIMILNSFNRKLRPISSGVDIAQWLYTHSTLLVLKDPLFIESSKISIFKNGYPEITLLSCREIGGRRAIYRITRHSVTFLSHKT